MRIVFMGTPIFACAILSQLLEDGYDVVGVVSQPDKKVGRKQILQETPVKTLAKQHGIDVFQPTSIKEDYETIYDFKADLIVTCAYGQMIPSHILQYPTYGSLNVHASLLPALRGGAPIHKAIMYGYEKTGVSIMRMVQKMDAGDYMLQEEVDILDTDTTSSLHDKLQECGAKAISKAIPLLQSKQAIFTKQDEDKVTYAYAITKEEELVDANKPCKEVYNYIRGLISWPVGYIIVQDKKVKLHEVKMTNIDEDVMVGCLYAYQKQLFLKCQKGSVQIVRLQLEGKSVCDAVQFIHGAGKKYHISL